jgi:hypothetical protein
MSVCYSCCMSPKPLGLRLVRNHAAQLELPAPSRCVHVADVGLSEVELPASGSVEAEDPNGRRPIVLIRCQSRYMRVEWPLTFHVMIIIVALILLIPL